MPTAEDLRLRHHGPAPASDRAPSLAEAWTLYSEVFEEIDTMAAQRHLMTEKEFIDVYHDPDVLKFYAYDADGALAGMSTITNNLDAWPLVSPRYFASRWPDHYERRAIWYVGFVGARPRRIHAFRELIARMYPLVNQSDGISVMDFCAYNVGVRRLPEVTRKLLGRLNSNVTMHEADTQSFFLFRFDETTAQLSGRDREHRDA